MENAPISRRVYWVCSGAVEVAPAWVLGQPPQSLTYFVSRRLVSLYIHATRLTTLMLAVNSRPLPYRTYYLTDSNVYIKIWWVLLLFNNIVDWIDFRPREVDYPSPMFMDPAYLAAAQFYADYYADLARELVSDLRYK